LSHECPIDFANDFDDLTPNQTPGNPNQLGLPRPFRRFRGRRSHHRAFVARFRMHRQYWQILGDCQGKIKSFSAISDQPERFWLKADR
jgi:hypothetical protein